jgi:hypothetical protein
MVGSGFLNSKSIILDLWDESIGARQLAGASIAAVFSNFNCTALSNIVTIAPTSELLLITLRLLFDVGEVSKVRSSV